MSDSDSDCELVMVRTTSSHGHKSAPDNIDYKIKIKPNNKKTIGLLYTLKKGQILPYSPDLSRYSAQITFGRDLQPDLGLGWTRENNKGFWIFKGKPLCIAILAFE